jgi:hypothetical protein
LATIGTAAAQTCIRAGGWGTGVMESFASFMSDAAMKNQAKAWGGESVKITKVSQKCEWKSLAFECTTFARACKGGVVAAGKAQKVMATGKAQ